MKSTLLFLFLFVLLGCHFHHPDISFVDNIKSDEIQGNNYLYAEKSFPEPWYYIVSKVDSALLYRIILLQKGIKYLQFYSDTLKPFTLNGNRFWKGKNNYFYKHNDGNYYIDKMKLIYTSNNNEIIQILIKHCFGT